MLVCNVSLRAPRRMIAAGLAEVTTALDAPGTGNVVFATLVDDPANVLDFVDAYSGEIMLEAASAIDAADATIAVVYDTVIAEATTAVSAQDGTLPAPATTWNPADKGATVGLSGGNLTAQNSSGGAGGVRSTTGLSSGKAYMEFIYNVNPAGSSVGIATNSASLTTVTPTGNVQCGPFGQIVRNTGSGGLPDIGTPSTTAPVCMALDAGNSLVWFRAASGNWNNDPTANPATGVGGIDASSLAKPFYAWRAASSTFDSNTANFGATAFSFSVPSGFSSWNAAV